MRPDEAADLAARTLAVIPERQPWPSSTSAHHAADRERVASDLAGLRQHYDWNDLGSACSDRHHDTRLVVGTWPCPDAARYADGLRLTASLYGVTP